MGTKQVTNKEMAEALSPPAVPTPVVFKVDRRDSHVQVVIAAFPEEIEERGYPWHEIEVCCRKGISTSKAFEECEWEWERAEISSPSHGHKIAHDMTRWAAALQMACGIAQMLDIEHGLQKDDYGVWKEAQSDAEEE